MSFFSRVPGWLCALCCVGLLGSGCSLPPDPPKEDFWAGPVTGSTWKEVFRDDFEGASGTQPNPAYWNLEVVPAPYNGEEQYYTNRPENVALDGTGNLVITALREALPDGNGQPYTSGRINTKGHFEPTYGRIEARVKIPAGKGLWPAFWMLGGDIDRVGWPACGEADIIEIGGSTPGRITGSLHGPVYNGTDALHQSYTKPSGGYDDDFHVYALEWTAQGMRWLIDEQPFAWRTPEGLREERYTWVFDKPMFVILNLAVGGIYDGAPNGSTPFPSRMLVDYVKVSTLVAPAATP
jgi:beta-glucanase (GH16 family)